MKQHEAVIQTLDQLGGVATLGELYTEVLKNPQCEWKTKTPFASIRRIVQIRPEIFKLKPGLYGLVIKKNDLESRGIIAETRKNQNEPQLKKSNHTYYQGLLLLLGKMKGFDCWAPNQDKNKLFITQPLHAFRTMQEMPPFSYEHFIRRSQSVDVIWFNERRMPKRFFEVECGSDIQNSLLKFSDLQDFYAEMIIVASNARRKEFEAKLQYRAFVDIKNRVKFITDGWVVKEYEHMLEGGKEVTVF